MKSFPVCRLKLQMTKICLAGLAVMLMTAPAGAQETDSLTFFPNDHLFAPLVADPKEPRFFATICQYDNDIRGDFTGASVGYGETFGLVRKMLGPRRGWQLNLRGGIFSQFDMDTSSNNLLNTDYTIGLLWCYRRHNLSLRTRAYHQSSHLGDEYAREHPEMLETATGFDYEAIDVLLAWDFCRFRTYGGLHCLVQREPEDIDRWGYQAGLEYHGVKEVVPYGVFVAGMDVKAFEELHWSPACSLKAGLNFRNLGRNGRYIKVMAQYYNGFIPYGQFYDYDMECYGLGIYFGF
mgnify:CR=1 FL=1